MFRKSSILDVWTGFPSAFSTLSKNTDSNSFTKYTCFYVLTWYEGFFLKRTFFRSFYPFSVWCPLKGHTYLYKAAGLFKYVWPFSRHQALKLSVWLTLPWVILIGVIGWWKDGKTCFLPRSLSEVLTKAKASEPHEYDLHLHRT